jgi:hypothetical protein
VLNYTRPVNKKVVYVVISMTEDSQAGEEESERHDEREKKKFSSLS